MNAKIVTRGANIGSTTKGMNGRSRSDGSIAALLSNDGQPMTGRLAQRRDDPVAPAMYPKYATISRWTEMTGMSRTGTYDSLGLGQLRAIKLRGRTLIDVESGLAWLASLPAAKIAAPRDSTGAEAN